MVCPHATIRAFLLDEEEMANLPEDIADDVLTPMGKDMGGLVYRIQVHQITVLDVDYVLLNVQVKKVKKH